MKSRLRKPKTWDDSRTFESGRGQPRSKTLRELVGSPQRRQALKCGCPLPLWLFVRTPPATGRLPEWRESRFRLLRFPGPRSQPQPLQLGLQFRQAALDAYAFLGAETMERLGHEIVADA